MATIRRVTNALGGAVEAGRRRIRPQAAQPKDPSASRPELITQEVSQRDIDGIDAPDDPSVERPTTAG